MPFIELLNKIADVWVTVVGIIFIAASGQLAREATLLFPQTSWTRKDYLLFGLLLIILGKA